MCSTPQVAALKDIEQKEAAAAEAEEARPNLESAPVEGGKDVIADWVILRNLHCSIAAMW